MQRMAQHDALHDLVEAQTAWYRTYWQLAESGPTASTARSRRRLQELSVHIAGHPYWCGPSGTPAARIELKELARRAVGR
ncbi:hypothetical protein PS467_41225 [Streptomyces luomodiensis]|uniref:Uncharacterized protein n=2 Tax=Streptomyces luomodiensis TaxID=3026192 RepID=A0ABY9VCB5_9ACTN|nr:hypothetical protein PS467_41225 [Streptomyces sp. SCA4-21]